MVITVTSLYAIALTLIYIVLMLRVVIERRTHKFAYGDNGSPRVQAKIRACANWAEVVPIALILMLIAELNDAPHLGMHLAGGILLIGRMMHGYSMSFVPKQIKLRMWGMLLTLIAVVTLLILCLPVWS